MGSNSQLPNKTKVSDVWEKMGKDSQSDPMSKVIQL